MDVFRPIRHRSTGKQPPVLRERREVARGNTREGLAVFDVVGFVEHEHRLQSAHEGADRHDLSPGQRVVHYYNVSLGGSQRRTAFPRLASDYRGLPAGGKFFNLEGPVSRQRVRADHQHVGESLE